MINYEIPAPTPALTDEGCKATMSATMPKAPTAPRGRPRAATLSPLGEWLDASGKDRDWLAGKLVLSRSFIDKLCRGHSLPGVEIAYKVETLTGGKIDLAMWAQYAAHQRAAKASKMPRRASSKAAKKPTRASSR